MNHIAGITLEAPQTAACPCCARPMPTDGVYGDKATGVFIVCGVATAPMTRSEFALVEFLSKKRGHLFTYDQVYHAMYGHRSDGGPLGGPDMIAVWVHKVRKILLGTRLHIETKCREGVVAYLREHPYTGVVPARANQGRNGGRR